uniref:F-box domain-containing protein n=1 Tax=Steinernema glaseri TaxID=37863 RepID=A0A1I8AWL8_9BILA
MDEVPAVFIENVVLLLPYYAKKHVLDPFFEFNFGRWASVCKGSELINRMYTCAVQLERNFHRNLTSAARLRQGTIREVGLVFCLHDDLSIKFYLHSGMIISVEESLVTLETFQSGFDAKGRILQLQQVRFAHDVRKYVKMQSHCYELNQQILAPLCNALRRSTQPMTVRFECAFPSRQKLIKSILSSITCIARLEYDDRCMPSENAGGTELLLTPDFLEYLLTFTWMPHFQSMGLQLAARGLFSHRKLVQKLFRHCIYSGQSQRYQIMISPANAELCHEVVTNEGMGEGLLRERGHFYEKWEWESVDPCGEPVWLKLFFDGFSSQGEVNVRLNCEL